VAYRQASARNAPPQRDVLFEQLAADTRCWLSDVLMAKAGIESVVARSRQNGGKLVKVTASRAGVDAAQARVVTTVPTHENRVLPRTARPDA
jgi:predicted NUDIX family NTP pyrophosphohydrolase